MVSKPANALNLSSVAGVVLWDGSATLSTTAITQYDVLVGGASQAISSIAPSATAGVPLVSNGGSANPSFTTAVVAGGGTGVATMTTPYAPVCSGTTATGALQVASTGLSSSGYVLTSNGSSALPSFQAAPGGSITITGDTGGGLAGNSFTFTGGTTGLAFGGSGSTETVSGTLIVGNGGTGIATMTTAYAPVCAGTTATGALQVASTGLSSANYVLTSTGASSLPTFQALPSLGITWTDVTGTTAALVASNGYIADNVSVVTMTLPSSAALGSLIWVVGKGSGGWSIAQRAGQTIHMNASSSTTGTGGSLASTAQYNAALLLCTTANTDYVVIMMMGILTLT